MPAPQIMSFAKKAGKSESEVERLWQKAKDSAEKQGRSEDYPYIVGILKKMLGLGEDVEVPVAPFEVIKEDGEGATVSNPTTTADYPIKPVAGGNPTKPRRRVLPDSIIYGMAAFEVDSQDFMGMSKARMSGSRYPIKNEKVREFMRENHYNQPYILKYEGHILKIGKHMNIAK